MVQASQEEPALELVDEPAFAERGRGRADNPEEVVAAALYPDEHLWMMVECLRRRRLHIFERSVIALTERRLMVISPAFPWGYQLDGAYPLSSSWVVNGKERIDGSRLMVLKHEGGMLCLYFGRNHRDKAEAILTAVGLDPTRAAPPQPASSPTHHDPPEHADFVEVTMELSELSHTPNEEEDYA